MSPNIGTIDRLIRLLAGIALVGGSLTSSGSFGNAWLQYGAFALGIVAIVTATSRFCPLYRLLGIRTCAAE